MEGGDQNVGSRWNPTKEQIEMLESLYKQGLRTPTAEQIQHITVRLREFGYIEGKNVFYWFQNHKARQRQKQKQKQENFAYFNRFLHKYQNVVCSPCYSMPPSKNLDHGFYKQYPRVPLSAAAHVGNFKRSRVVIPDQTVEHTRYNRPMHDSRRQNHEAEYNLQLVSGTKQRTHHHHQETLDLFPIHPTGILEAKNGITENKNLISSANTSSSSDDDNDCSIFGDAKAEKGHPFFDFFCQN